MILGVVEKLFIKGGEFISENIKYLTPALTSKASATFKFEILKLLKVLLVDTKEDALCPSPLTFAEHFIENSGMHILLYLCINSPLDVISMCLKLIDVLSSLKKSKKLSLDTDIIPFLSNIILAKIKEKPALYTPSGKNMKRFDLLPRIDEELEVNMAEKTQESLLKRTNSDDAINFNESIPESNISLQKMSTQKFSSMKFGLELDVDEANKHFDRHNPAPAEEKVEEVEAFANRPESKKIRQEFMLDDSILKQTKEVPSGPKSKSVPRNLDFFGSTQQKEENKSTSGGKGGFNFMLDNQQESNEEDKEASLIIESGAPPSKDSIKGVIKKRFAFLDTGNDEDEEIKDPSQDDQFKKNKQVMNPAATGATEFQSDSSSERSEVIRFQGKQQFRKPVINTEAINEMFTYGGEKGDMLIRLDGEADEQEQFLKELDEIATICVAHMNRESPEDEVVLDDLEDTKEEEKDYSNRPNEKKKDFMTPQTLKGYTKIEFTMNKEDDIKPMKSYLKQDQNVIQEEQSPLATSKSSSSRPDLQTPTSLNLDTPKTLLEKQAVEEFNQGIEALYVSILEWLLNRSPSNLNEPLMIDDSDEINNPNVLIICFNLIKHSNDLLKQKALQDFQMLAKLNKSNCSHVMQNKFFHPWIMELLLPYQISLSQKKLVGSAMAVYDIGSKFHTIVMVHSLVNESKNNSILYLARWPLILAQKEEPSKIESAYQLVKHLMSSILKSVTLEAGKCRPSVDQPIWANVARIVFVIDEIVFNGKPKNFIFKEGIKSVYEDYSHVLNKTFTKSNTSQVEGSPLLSDSCIFEDIFKVLNFLWPVSLFAPDESVDSKEGKILSILSRTSDDDFAKDIELLM